jgi:hypothetical protein
MARPADPVDIGSVVPLDTVVAMRVPSRWRLLCHHRRPTSDASTVESFTEFADGGIVVTVVTREYWDGPEVLLSEMVGSSPTGRPALALRLGPRMAGCGRLVTEGPDASFVAGLVYDGRGDGEVTVRAVEIVADGPAAEVARHVPTLHRVIATVGPTTAATGLLTP